MLANVRTTLGAGLLALLLAFCLVPATAASATEPEMTPEQGGVYYTTIACGFIATSEKALEKLNTVLPRGLTPAQQRKRLPAMRKAVAKLSKSIDRFARQVADPAQPWPAAAAPAAAALAKDLDRAHRQFERASKGRSVIVLSRGVLRGINAMKRVDENALTDGLVDPGTPC